MVMAKQETMKKRNEALKGLRLVVYTPELGAAIWWTRLRDQLEVSETLVSKMAEQGLVLAQANQIAGEELRRLRWASGVLGLCAAAAAAVEIGAALWP